MDTDDNYADHDLVVDNETLPEDIFEFIEDRTKNPIVMDGTTIFNYCTHTILKDQLREKVNDLYRSQYVMPFQLGPVWAFMVHHIPDEVRTLEYLVYDSNTGRYAPHRNHARIHNATDNESPISDLDEWADENTNGRGRFRIDSEDTELQMHL